jgi:hypothetical protein
MHHKQHMQVRNKFLKKHEFEYQGTSHYPRKLIPTKINETTVYTEDIEATFFSSIVTN